MRSALCRRLSAAPPLAAETFLRVTVVVTSVREQAFPIFYCSLEELNAEGEGQAAMKPFLFLEQVRCRRKGEAYGHSFCEAVEVVVKKEASHPSSPKMRTHGL